MLVIDSAVNRTVKGRGQLTRHACVSGQNASCARAVVSHFAELIDVFVIKTCNRDIQSKKGNRKAPFREFFRTYISGEVSIFCL